LELYFVFLKQQQNKYFHHIIFIEKIMSMEKRA